MVEKVKNNKISEVIFALGTTMEGDTTNFYIYRQLLFMVLEVLME